MYPIPDPIMPVTYADSPKRRTASQTSVRPGSIGQSGTFPVSRQFTRAPGYTGPMPSGSFGLTATPSSAGFPSLPPVSGGGGLFGPLINRGLDWLGDQLFGGPASGPTSGSTAGEGTGGCPTGYQFNPSSGRCEAVGVAGTVQRFLPGGQTGTLNPGQAVMGAFGIPAVQPAVVGQRANDRGEVNPILRCPPGAVLGKDNLCYQKSSIPKKYRKWAPAPKPPMSAADAKALRRIGTLQNKVKGLAKNAGLTCRNRR